MIISDELLWCPAGYLPVHKIPKRARQWAEEGVIDPGFKEVFDGPGFLAEIIGSSLADGTLPAIGVSLNSGALLAILPTAWRRWHRNVEGSSQRFTYAIEAALAEQCIWMGDEPDEQPCYAAVALSDLARWLDAKEIPPEPPEQPAGRQAVPGSAIVPLSAAAAPRNLGGRFLSHDWDAFWIEVVAQLTGDALTPERRTALQRHMCEWMAGRNRHPPEDSTIRRKLQRLDGRIGRARERSLPPAASGLTRRSTS